MDTQFDNEPIDFIDPTNIYYCSPRARSSGFTLLMKWGLSDDFKKFISEYDIYPIKEPEV